MEGLIVLAVFGIGWKSAELYLTIKIRSEESRFFNDRINLLEDELRWQTARADGFLHDIQRKAQVIENKAMTDENKKRALANGWDWVLGERY